MTEDILKKINIEKDTYVRLLKDILATCRKTYLKLDMYYDKLLWYNSLIQTSVIIASTGSTFIQSFLKEEHDDMVGIITLSVSTYSGLILSFGKGRESIGIDRRYIDPMKVLYYGVDWGIKILHSFPVVIVILVGVLFVEVVFSPEVRILVSCSFLGQFACHN